MNIIKYIFTDIASLKLSRLKSPIVNKDLAKHYSYSFIKSTQSSKGCVSVTFLARNFQSSVGTNTVTVPPNITAFERRYNDNWWMIKFFHHLRRAVKNKWIYKEKEREHWPAEHHVDTWRRRRRRKKPAGEESAETTIFRAESESTKCSLWQGSSL